MKKLGLGVLTLVIAAGIYYFSAGSEKLATAMKTQVDAEFASLKTQGFSIANEETSKKEEHFEISFDDSKKIADYITSKGASLSEDDAKALTGLKIGIDVRYLADAYSSVSFDMYPMTLPTSLTQSTKSPKDIKLLEQIKTMMENKVFLTHIDVNKLGTGFKGYVKDIDETLEAEETLNLVMKAFTFKGSIEDEKLTRMSQALKSISFSVANEMLVTFADISSEYALSGPSTYDYTSSYMVDSIKAKIDNEFDFTLKGLKVDSDSAVEKALAKVSLNTHIEAMSFKDKAQDTALNSLNLKMDFDNLSVASMKKLETLDPENEAELQAVVKELLSQGLTFNLSDFSIETLKIQDKDIKGFKLNAAMALDKNLDFTAIEKNPMLAMAAIDADLKLSLSDDLFALAAQQPQAVMVMMMIQPEAVNGQKVYKVELKDGKVSVNGKPMM